MYINLTNQDEVTKQTECIETTVPLGLVHRLQQKHNVTEQNALKYNTKMQTILSIRFVYVHHKKKTHWCYMGRVMQLHILPFAKFSTGYFAETG